MMALQVPSLSALRSPGVDLSNADPATEEGDRLERRQILGERPRPGAGEPASRWGPGRGTYRCDRCGAQAYVRALLPNGLELLFCAHHKRQHSSALTKIAVDIHEETGRLARPAA